MRVSISGSNGSARMRCGFVPDEARHLMAGGRDDWKVRVEGDAAHGLRFIADQTGLTPKIADGHVFLDMAVDIVQASHDPVCMVDLVTDLSRDDYGPIIITQPLPAPMVPRERRQTAKRQLEGFEQSHAAAFANRLFRSRAVVRPENHIPVAWTYESEFAGGEIHRRIAKLTCSSPGCAHTVEISQKVILPDEVTAKKFKQKGWWIKDTKATCPSCQTKHTDPEGHSPRDIVAVLDTVTKKRLHSVTLAGLREAIGEVNRILDAMNDPAVLLKLTKNRLSAGKWESI